VLDRAEQRVAEAINPGKVSDKTDQSREIEIMSFPVSLMLVKSTKLDHVMNRYALAEALRVESFLKLEKNDKVIEEIFENFLGIKMERNKDSIYPSFKISIEDYVERAVKFRKPEWKLVNRIVEKGKVFVSQQDLIRLIREEIRDLIMQRLNAVNIPKLPPALESRVKKLIEMAPPPPRSTFTIINVSPENYPPCVRTALNMLEKGENVPHYGRFLMATYLLAVGKTVDDIMALFPKAPDFKQSITKYQVEHIAGLKGGRTRYSVPSCSTLQTHSFCFKDPVKCYDISKPTQYPSTRSPSVSEDSQKKSKRVKTPQTDERRKDWTKPRR
jgi:DNA primase large subunit